MGQFLTVSSVIMCPHGGTVSVISTNTRAQAVGGYILRPSDVFTVAGCGLSSSGGPFCATVQWIVAGLRGKAAGDRVLTTDSVGLCCSAAGTPLGSAVVAFAQGRVSGQ